MKEIKFVFIILLVLINIISTQKQTITNKSTTINSTLIQQNNNSEKNTTLSFKSNGPFLVLNAKYTTSKKLFIKFIIIFILLLIILSLIYSFCKVPFKKSYESRCCQRTKYFCKGLFFLIFLPCTIAFLLMTGIFGFLEGIFPKNEEEDIQKNKKSKKNKFFRIQNKQ